MPADPPEGFEITVDHGIGWVTYEWSTLGTGSCRRVTIFLASVFGIGFGFAFVGSVVVAIAHPNERWVWLIVLAFGVNWLSALWGMRLAISGGRPERVILGDDSFTYDTGGSGMTRGLAIWANLNQMSNPLELYSGMFRRRKQITIEDDVPTFILDKIGIRQRLYFDQAADRIEIGMPLREPEREWLAEQLQSWQCNLD